MFNITDDVDAETNKSHQQTSQFNSEIKNSDMTVKHEELGQQSDNMHFELKPIEKDYTSDQPLTVKMPPFQSSYGGLASAENQRSRRHILPSLTRANKVACSSCSNSPQAHESDEKPRWAKLSLPNNELPT